MGFLSGKPATPEKQLAQLDIDEANTIKLRKDTYEAIPALDAAVDDLIRAGAPEKERHAAMGAHDAAQKLLLKCDAVLLSIEKQRSEIRAEIAKAAKQKEANAYASEQEELDAEAKPVFAALASTRELAIKLLHRYAERGVLEAHGSEAFLMVGRQIDLALENVLHESMVLARDVRELRKPVVKAPPALVETLAPVEELVRAFSVQPVRWASTKAARFSYIDISPARYQIGLKNGWLIPVSDPRCTELAQKKATDQVELHHCNNLDTDAPATAAPVQLPPGFEPMDRGPPRQITHREPRAPLVAGATRSVDDEETR